MDQASGTPGLAGSKSAASGSAGARLSARRRNVWARVSCRSPTKLRGRFAVALAPLCKVLCAYAADGACPCSPTRALVRPPSAGRGAAQGAAGPVAAAAAGRPTCRLALASGPAGRCRLIPWSRATGAGSGGSAPRPATGSWARLARRTCTAGQTGEDRRQRRGARGRPSPGRCRLTCRRQHTTATASTRRRRRGGMRSRALAGSRHRGRGRTRTALAITHHLTRSSSSMRQATHRGTPRRQRTASSRAATLPPQQQSSSRRCRWRQGNCRHCRGRPAKWRKERLGCLSREGT